MQVESPHLSPIEKELSFILWRKNRKNELFLIDLDDTICDTIPIFRKQNQEAIKYLTQNSSIDDNNSLENEIRDINDMLFEQHGVNPDRWDQVVDIVAKKYRLDPEESDHTKEIYQRIYTTPLQMKPGAKAGLDFLKETNTPTAIVTHANKPWTWRKYNWMDLGNYLDWDDVFIVDENGHKNSQSWQQGLDYFKRKANQCAVVGDSPRSDINPAWSIGIRHCFLIKNEIQWSIHQQAVPPQIRIIKNLGELREVGREELSLK